MSSTHIMIIGAGVGGLAFAQGLKRRNIPFSVSERDGFLDSRLQGYRIKVFGDMKAKLNELLTPEAWTTFEATCAQTLLGETNLNAADASITACRRARLPPGAPLPYTVDRGLLRQALMTGIESSVHFGKQFDRYELVEGGVKAFFRDGSVECGTLLVGADGSHSAVRRQFLPGMDAIDTGVCCVYGKSPLGAELQARFPKKHRRWITVIRDQTPTIQSIISGDGPVTLVSEPCHFTNRESYSYLPDDYVHWGILFRKDSLALGDQELDEALKQDSPGLALDITGEWDPSIRSLIELQDKSLTSGMRVYSADSKIQDWTSSAHVTVLGDAVHVMSPSGGVGAVAALNDAFELMRAITHEGISTESISRYEQRMKGFAEVCIRRSNAAGAKMLDLPLV
ncbi:FAD/NAD(P)-binding domain-containing protein [Glonium stellatum]|uniref:FAD/NAD(P)-binding domain-containing protein n=1 Tax=Glonium stellatum TaxID=574774 RepID=A0A8E2EVK4_9PEZI|nr:FAD/NAD(P)-binding domain-containing protein [Glonium stellatum]